MNFARGYLMPGQTVQYSEPAKGFELGFLVNLALSERVSLQPEYLYSRRKTLLPQSNSSLKLDYLSMPVMLHVQLGRNISVHGGPQVDLLISGTRKEKGTKTDITHDTEERNIAVAGGMRYAIKTKYFIEARYLHGLNNVGIGQRSDVREFKFQAVMISFGARL